MIFKDMLILVGLLTRNHPTLCNSWFVVVLVIPALGIGVLNHFHSSPSSVVTAVSMSLFIYCLFDQFKAQRNPTPITLKLTCHKLLLLLAYQV